LSGRLAPKELFSSEADILRDLPKERGRDVLTGVKWNGCPTAIRVAVLLV